MCVCYMCVSVTCVSVTCMCLLHVCLIRVFLLHVCLLHVCLLHGTLLSQRTRSQTKCAMMVAVDEGLRNITNDLRELGLMDNLLIVFTSDNGGNTDEGSSNWPLRGAKRTLWEGGIRVNTFMYS